MIAELEVAKYIPKNLRGLPLYQQVSSVLQHLVDEHYLNHLRVVDDKWRVNGANFNVDDLISLTGRYSLIDTSSLTTEEKTTLALLLPKADELKGTRFGLSYAIRIFGFDIEYYEWWNTDFSLPNFVGLAGSVKSCDILFIINLGIPPVSEPFLIGRETKFLEAVERALWICARPNVWTRMRFEEFVPTPEEDDEKTPFQFGHSPYDIQQWLLPLIDPNVKPSYVLRVATPDDPLNAINDGVYDISLGRRSDYRAYRYGNPPSQAFLDRGYVFAPEMVGDIPNPDVVIFGHSALRKDVDALSGTVADPSKFIVNMNADFPQQDKLVRTIVEEMDGGGLDTEPGGVVDGGGLDTPSTGAPVDGGTL